MIILSLIYNVTIKSDINYDNVICWTCKSVIVKLGYDGVFANE